MTNSPQHSTPHARPLALVTGAGRPEGIAYAIALELAGGGWDVAFSYLTSYDDRMDWGATPGAADRLSAELAGLGAETAGFEADLASPDTPAQLFDAVTGRFGGRPVDALVMCHAESVDSSILDTSVESFDRHFAVNARASWLLLKEYGSRFAGTPGRGRIVALTSDHTAHNLPYGASKGALDRIVLAAAREFAGLGVTANVINPGPVDNGWMPAPLKARLTEATPLGRLGVPRDCANLVGFLCSERGGWINGQLLSSDGGIGS
ncbi:SDR family oxidoreductase [Streptomyces sp. NPDC091271]|uniref:SDR family oxidoreductase n=1 Tax=Streptomyces sp. NPDC091271 TaxID=3365980 RepID=UPI0038144D1B